MKVKKSVIDEAQDIRRAVELVSLGARMQMLEAETRLSRERLLRIYKEVRGMSPPKGMLPFSTDWFMAWQPNVHGSLFMAFHAFFARFENLSRLEGVIKAYHLYLDHIEAQGMDPVLSITRAWTLVRFFEADLLHQAPCTSCTGAFIVHAHDPVHDYVCGLCNMPSRAGKGRKRGTVSPSARAVRKQKSATASV